MVTMSIQQGCAVSMGEILGSMAKLKAEWFEATGGKMSSVKVNLNLLFDDLFGIVQGGGLVEIQDNGEPVEIHQGKGGSSSGSNWPPSDDDELNRLRSLAKSLMAKLDEAQAEIKRLKARGGELESLLSLAEDELRAELEKQQSESGGLVDPPGQRRDGGDVPGCH